MTTFDQITKIFSGTRMPKIYHPEVPIGQVILFQCYRYPDKVIQISADDGIWLRNEDLAKMMKQVAGFLHDCNIKFGDVIGFCGKNSTYLAPTVLGCVLYGAIFHSVDVDSDFDLKVKVFGQTKPKLVFCDHDQAPEIESVLYELNNDARIIILTKKFKNFMTITEIFQNTPDTYEVPLTFDMESEKICAAILSSSGSTGDPKLTRLSHAQLLQSVNCFNGFADSQLLFNFYSLFWISGTTFIIYSVLNQHTRLITTRPFTPKICLDLVEKYKPTQMTLSPTDIAAIVKYLKTASADLSSVKFIYTGAWFISEETIKAMEGFLNGGRVLPCYGMTETGACLTRSLAEDPPSCSVGRLCLNTQAKILMKNRSLGGIGDSGEILVKRECNFLGYLNNEKETKKLIDDESWIHTGDIGYFDESLRLFVLGRLKFMIRCYNHHFSPVEIEEAIARLPGVANVCVVAIPHYEAFDAPCAVIERENSSSITEKDVKAAVSHLEYYKQPFGGIIFVKKLPLTATGKLNRFLIGKLAMSELGHC